MLLYFLGASQFESNSNASFQRLFRSFDHSIDPNENENDIDNKSELKTKQLTKTKKESNHRSRLVYPDSWSTRVFIFSGVQPGRSAECPAGRPAGRSSAAPVSSASPKKKAFDRGGLVWPPRSNAPAKNFRKSINQKKNTSSRRPCLAASIKC